MFNSNMTPVAIFATVGAMFGMVTMFIGMRKAKLEYDAAVYKPKPRQRTHQVQNQTVQKAETKTESKYEPAIERRTARILLAGYLMFTAGLLGVINKQAGFTTPQLMVIVMIASSVVIAAGFLRVK